MVEGGWLDEVDHFLAGHLGASLGTIAATTTGFLSTTKLDVEPPGHKVGKLVPEPAMEIAEEPMQPI